MGNSVQVFEAYAVGNFVSVPRGAKVNKCFVSNTVADRLFNDDGTCNTYVKDPSEWIEAEYAMHEGRLFINHVPERYYVVRVFYED